MGITESILSSVELKGRKGPQNSTVPHFMGIH